MDNRLNIAVLSYNQNKYSETFIRNQVKHLNGNIHYLYGGELPGFYNNEQRFLKKDFFSRGQRWFQGLLFNRTEYEQHKEAVEKYLLKNKMDIVIANYSVTALPVMEMCQRNGIPLIVHFHGWTAYRKSILAKYGKEYPRLFQIAAAIVAVSFDMKKQLESLGAPSEKIHVLRCGADETLFTYSNHVNNPPVYFSPGRFCETKNPELTIKAFALVKVQIPEAKLIMAGGDEGLLQKCIQLAQMLNLKDSVVFKQPLAHGDIYLQMKNAAALVLHSATTIEGEKEGTPVTTLEAALSGLPVVATRHAGIAEVFEHNKTALLSDEFDVAGMAANMTRIVLDKKSAETIALNAKDLVHQKFTLGTYSTALNAIIAKCVN